MSKTISANLQSHLEQSVTTLAMLWRIERTDGVSEYYTNHDQVITYDSNSYSPVNSTFSETEIRNGFDLSVDSLELDIVLGGVDRDDLLAGVYDYAEVYFGLIDYTTPADGLIKLTRGNFGEITIVRGMVRAEQHSLTSRLQHQMMEVTSPTCRADLGDTRCGVSLAPLKVTGSAVNVEHEEDFADYAVGTKVGSLADWTSRWRSNNNAWQVAAPTGDGAGLGLLGGQAFEWQSDTGDRFFFSWDKADGSHAQVEMLVKFTCHKWYSEGFYLVLRGSGAAGSETGYMVGARSASLNQYMTAWRWNSGSSALLASTGTVNVADTRETPDKYGWLRVRITDEATGVRIKFKTWTDSASEPASWQIDHLDTSGSRLEAGDGSWYGFGGNITDGVTRCDFISAGLFAEAPSHGASSDGGLKYGFHDTTRNEANNFFNGGKITFTSGNNNGYSAEVKDFNDTNRFVTLWEPMPYTIAEGDTYEMWPGCDKTLETCRDTYNNVPNFRGEPHLPGQDVISQTPNYSEQNR